MRIRNIVATAAIALALGGCDYVKTADFAAYRAGIKADGDALDVWVAATHQWILWLNANADTFCPSCGLPPLPPDPPPDGDW